MEQKITSGNFRTAVSETESKQRHWMTWC